MEIRINTDALTSDLDIEALTGRITAYVHAEQAQREAAAQLSEAMTDLTTSGVAIGDGPAPPKGKVRRAARRTTTPDGTRPAPSSPTRVVTVSDDFLAERLRQACASDDPMTLDEIRQRADCADQVQLRRVLDAIATRSGKGRGTRYTVDVGREVTDG
jgi:hypothetical protein